MEERLAAIEAALKGDGLACMDLASKVYVKVGTGAPTDGTSGTGYGVCGIGSLYIDSTNGKAYINTGTLASPTWTVVGTQTT